MQSQSERGRNMSHGRYIKTSLKNISFTQHVYEEEFVPIALRDCDGRKRNFSPSLIDIVLDAPSQFHSSRKLNFPCERAAFSVVGQIIKGRQNTGGEHPRDALLRRRWQEKMAKKGTTSRLKRARHTPGFKGKFYLFIKTPMTHQEIQAFYIYGAFP